jgi:protein-S-isoprenylcysteine O-methyltransferase Ste14
MSARDWLRNARGEWYVLGQGVLVGAVLIAPALDRGYRWSGVSGALGAALGLAGIGGVVLGVVGLGWRNVSPFPKPRDGGGLVDRGAFSIVRHPIYSGLSLAALGWSVMWSSLPAFVLAIALLGFFDIKARREERWLTEKFPRYEAYRSRVKKLIPFVY